MLNKKSYNEYIITQYKYDKYEKQNQDCTNKKNISFDTSNVYTIYKCQLYLAKYEVEQAKFKIIYFNFEIKKN